MTSKTRLFSILALAFLGVALIALTDAQSPAAASELVVEVICPSDEPCDVAAYSLSGFVQTENPVVFEYWPGQVPCDMNTNPPFPCPAGGNTRNVPDAAIEAGIEEWATVPSPVDTLYVKLPAPPLSSRCGGVFNGLDTLQQGTDGRNTVMWAPLNGSVIGIACWWTGTNEVDIILDNTWPGMDNAESARTVLLHEVGHGMGLNHSEVPGAVMAAIFAGPTHLQADDVAGYCAVYGCSAIPTASHTPTATATRTASPTPSPTPTPPAAFRCGERIYPGPVVCKRVPRVARD